MWQVEKFISIILVSGRDLIRKQKKKKKKEKS